jgi:hypothetical protein
MRCPALRSSAGVGIAVAVAAHLAVAHHDGFDLLVAQHSPAAAAGSLLDADFLAARVVEADVQAGDGHMVGSLPGRDDRDAAHIALIAGVHLGQLAVDQVGIESLQGSGFDRHPPAVAVDVDDHIFFGFALDFKGVKASKLQIWAEVAAAVAVDHGVRLGRNGEGGHFSGAGVGGDAADRAARQDQLIFRVVPAGLGRTLRSTAATGRNRARR